MKKEVLQKVYAPVGDGLDIRVRNTLSGLEDAPARRMSARRIAALAACMVLAVTAAVAGAAGMLFSDEYDAVRLASRALAQEYGITEEMQTYFASTVEEADGVTTIVFSGMPDMHHVLGEYTVVIRDGDATVTWSHDGQSTEGELDAHAWGAKQIEILLEMAREEQGFSRGYHKAQEIRAQMEDGEVTVSITKGDDTSTIVALDGAADSAVISISEEQAIAIAKEAFAAEYGLTQTQLEAMQYEKDYAGYTYAVKDGVTICELWFWLHQVDDVYHTDGDGLYSAQINAQTGVVENMFYDSALAGNG
ncbi:MAG: hypothetical protein IJ313_10960 [Clostridia bacterium]|nr:hypothetical protein [Clostridia bacterium]